MFKRKDIAREAFIIGAISMLIGLFVARVLLNISLPVLSGVVAGLTTFVIQLIYLACLKG